jgi:nesprin-1
MRITAIQDKASDLLGKYPSVEMSSLAKDANVLAKKFESLVGRAERIDDLLVGALEQHCSDSQQQLARWLAGAGEKVAWCGDIGGDRYSVEAKLATMKVRRNLIKMYKKNTKKFHKKKKQKNIG